MTRGAEHRHVDVRRTIQAPVELLYKAWTDPGMVQKWFAPGQVVRKVECDVRTSGGYRFECGSERSGVCVCRGEYVVVEPNRTLAFTWTVEGCGEGDVQDTLVTVEFTPSADFKSTEVRIRHERLPSDSARDGTDRGWTEILDMLDKLHEIDALERGLKEQKQRLSALRKALPRMPVTDCDLTDVGTGQRVSLRELFGARDELMIVHNMGKKCPYCTLWADGFNGVQAHLNDRAAFVVLTPDDPGQAREFAASRGWGFRLVSGHGTDFIRHMGFEPEAGRHWPGVSTLRRGVDGHIERVAMAHFSPMDDYCAVWPLMEMLERGQNGWQPKYRY